MENTVLVLITASFVLQNIKSPSLDAMDSKLEGLYYTPKSERQATHTCVKLKPLTKMQHIAYIRNKTLQETHHEI